MNNTSLIIDFDSTFIKTEFLDELATYLVKSGDVKKSAIAEIEAITEQGMRGEVAFGESLRRRLKLLRFVRKDIDCMVEILREKISNSILRNKKYFQSNSSGIYIISGGFFEVIYPIAQSFGIDENNIFANKFLFDEKGNFIGIDEDNVMSKNGGKINQIRRLNLENKSVMIGDGWTDYETKQEGVVNEFIAFTENIRRENVCNKADFVANNFDEVIDYLQKI